MNCACKFVADVFVAAVWVSFSSYSSSVNSSFKENHKKVAH